MFLPTAGTPRAYARQGLDYSCLACRTRIKTDLIPAGKRMRSERREMKTDLTVNELSAISDLLALEESVCKKARIYSETLTDPEISQALKKVAENHGKRFCDLFSLIG